MNNDITIIRVPTGLSVPAYMQDAQNRLLGRFNEQPHADNLQAAVNDKNTVVILAIAGKAPENPEDWQHIPTEAYAGTATLLILQTPWRAVAHIEEVIVDAGHEGKGIGKKLMQKAIEIGHDRGIQTFDLTSGPSKVAAQALYEKIGFKKRETNNWRYEG
jgi:ribosomal protein S18 acetylase RimI-like enzyme